jgi:predicted DNA-binding transcriptional regulator AlpA
MDRHTAAPHDIDHDHDAIGRRRRVSGGGLAYLSDAELASRWGVSPVTLWRMRTRGELPRPERISPGRVATRLTVIEAIEAARAAAADRDQPRDAA